VFWGHRYRTGFVDRIDELLDEAVLLGAWLWLWGWQWLTVAVWQWIDVWLAVAVAFKWVQSEHY
jgi:hypothetical protein